MSITQAQLKHRMRVERAIVDRTVDALLAVGYILSVFDGEEVTIQKSAEATLIKAALITTDDDWLWVHTKDGSKIGWVRFVYGNDGWDVICDYTTNLEEALKPVNDYAQQEVLLEEVVLEVEKPRSRLFQDVTEEAYRNAFRELLILRAQYPSYRDDELLMYRLSGGHQ